MRGVNIWGSAESKELLERSNTFFAHQVGHQLFEEPSSVCFVDLVRQLFFDELKLTAHVSMISIEMYGHPRHTPSARRSCCFSI